jgi:two-component system cell cycle response regulator DivK
MMRALIAEDNAVNRELLRELLEARAFDVSEACDGEEALEMIARERPDVLLLDLGMPKLDGFGVLRKIRESTQLADMPVLAVTAYAMRGDREKALDAGFDGYVSKPIDAVLLDQELDRVLASRREGASKGLKGGDGQPS